MGKRGFLDGLVRGAFAANAKSRRQEERMRQLMAGQAQAQINQINSRIAGLSSAHSIAQVKKHFDSIAILVGHLKNIEARFSGLVDPPTSKIEAGLQQKRDELIRDVATRSVELNIDKALAVTRKSTKASLLDKSRMLVAEARRELEDPEFFDALVKKIEDTDAGLAPGAPSIGNKNENQER